ncbi:putative TetR family transcriptional regulator [Gordonia effusa NBRC 100432]|uniref:Putative TetR family transcriptional regulator n=1 Tax=Gordonia effusa NBRC 100432 TaxID=1077974 RepID=H0QVT7_9ACTN|nr:TetR/AcrR family transcriptional regulator [Gordonia effusa]GAB16938.1 putative TetR family transcriptional regulator [Gordonia effusa NBRC 100432]
MTSRTDVPAKRTRMTPQARREQFLDLGMEMLRDHSLEDVTTEAIADAAGVSRALLFHYFESKQDFHVALASAQAKAMLERTAPDPSLGEPLEILRGSMSAFVDFVYSNAGAYRAILRGVASADPALQQVFAQTRATMAQRITDYSEVLGIAVTPLVEMAVHGWLSFVEEVTLAWLADHADVDRDQLLGLITGSLPMLASVAAAVSQ